MKEKLATAGVFLVLAGLFAFAANDWKLPRAGARPAEDWCEEHQAPESTCEKCRPELARGGTGANLQRELKEGECPNSLARVTLGSGAAEKAQLAFHALESVPVPEVVRANAETIYPPSRFARVASRLPGAVREVKVTLGQEVEAGTALAILESAEFGQAKADYLQAAALLRLREKTFEQEKALFEKKITAGRELLAAETGLGEARLGEKRALQRLLTLGLTAEKVKELEEKQETSPLIEVRAPFAGQVVEASAVPGDLAGPEKPLFSVAAMDRLWAMVDLYEADLPRVRKGQPVVFTLGSLPDKRFEGKVVAVGGEVDERTRTAHVYAEIGNTEGLLRARMFGRAEVTVKEAVSRLVVPREAVQNDDDCTFVFIASGKEVFLARRVRLGPAYGEGFEVLEGLAAGDRVVTRGSFLLKTEVLRNQMGTG
jgi:cobalt-zinc-cadmium efflux system membrane fusion protein